MKPPLAFAGEGFHRVRVRHFLLSIAIAGLATPAFAQMDRAAPQDRPTLPEILPAPDVPPDLPPDLPEGDPLNPDANPDAEAETETDTSAPPLPPATDADEADEQPDYSQLSSAAERSAKLDDMFARLQSAESEAKAKLIAEEIWAVWVRSGSPSVDFTLRRAAASQARGDARTARALYDVVTDLQPEFAEGWARSARLALSEEDFSRAIGDAVRALQYEPRHYYALWTMANVLERMGKREEALEAYREANRLYPKLESVSERVEALERELGGGVL